MEKIFSSKNFDFFKPEDKELEMVFAGDILNGFPSPSEAFVQEKIDMNKVLNKHSEATFIARAKGLSNYQLINPGDLVIIDKAEEWEHDKLCICFINGDFNAKWIEKKNNIIRLLPFNDSFPTITIDSSNEFIIWGIVTWILHKPHGRPHRL